MKKLVLLLAVLALLQSPSFAQSFDFSNVSLGFGTTTKGDGNVKDLTMMSLRMMYTLETKKEEGSSFGYLTDFTSDFSSDFKLTSLSLDLGGGGVSFIAEDVNMFIGLCLFSMNLNTYHDHPFGSSIYLGFNYKKIFLESRMVVWNWAKGKDPVFRQDSRLSINYAVLNWLALGAQVISYAPGYQYYHFKVSWMIGN
ncbi:MAG: hypothetical protein JXR34_12590 [Bacteroidales bacterium]|nr:hypothetical protein [Bacteroidales bacterium]